MPIEVLGIRILDAPVTIPGHLPGAVVRSEGNVYLYGLTATGVGVSITATLSAAGNVLSAATSCVRPYVGQSDVSAPAATYMWFRQADRAIVSVSTTADIAIQFMKGPVT